MKVRKLTQLDIQVNNLQKNNGQNDWIFFGNKLEKDSFLMSFFFIVNVFNAKQIHNYTLQESR